MCLFIYIYMMSLQQEWQFVQHVTPGVGPLFLSLEEEFRDEFLPSLLCIRTEEVTDCLHKRITWDMKRAGIGIPDPTHTAPTNFETSEHYCEVLTSHCST